MAEPPKHEIAVLEDEAPPEVPPPEPAPSLFENLRRFMVPLIAVGTLFAIIVGIGLCLGFAFVWRDPPPEAPGGSLVVLPVVVQGEDATVADAFIDELYAALIAEPNLEVYPRADAAALADDKRGLGDIGTELGVRYVVQAEVDPKEDKVVVHFSLVDAELGGQLASERYKKPMAELATIDDLMTEVILVQTRCKVEE